MEDKVIEKSKNCLHWQTITQVRKKRSPQLVEKVKRTKPDWELPG